VATLSLGAFWLYRSLRAVDRSLSLNRVDVTGEPERDINQRHILRDKVRQNLETYAKPAELLIITIRE
jgi:hypothetical protein